MPDDKTDQTPQGGGTGNQTPQSGTEGQTATGSTSSTPPVDSIEYWKAEAEANKKKADASSRQYHQESSRWLSENQRLQAIMAHTANQQRQAAPVAPEPAKPNPREYLTDAVLDRDQNKLQAYEDYVIGKAEQRIMTKQSQEGARQQRINTSVAEISNVLKEPNSPLAHAAMQRYQAIQFNPYYQQTLADDKIDVGGVPVNPHILRIAVLEAQRDMAIKGGAAVDAAHAQSGFIEPVGGAPKGQSDKTKFNPDKHLTDNERTFCQNRGMSTEDYWKYMNTKVKEARLKSGKPVSSKDAGAA